MQLRREDRAAALADMVPLNALRFTASFYIVITHLWIILPWWPPLDRPHVLTRLGLLGYTAVGMFFILSGFSLSCVYLSTLDGPFPRRRFLLARFARLYPVFVLSLVLYAPRAWVELRHRWPVDTMRHALESLVGTLLLLQAWSQRFVYWNSATWFLSAEAFFFVLFLWLGPWLWRMRPGRAVVVSAFLMLAPFAITGLQKVVGGQHHLYKKPPAQLHQFLLGVLLARFYCSGALDRWSGQFWRWRVPLLGMTFFGALTAAALCLLPISWARALLQFGGLLPFNAALILFFCRGSARLSRLLSSRLPVRLGEISFSVYLLHMPIAYLMHLDATQSGLLALIYLPLTLIAGWFVFAYFETPARQWVLSRLHSRRQESAPAAALT